MVQARRGEDGGWMSDRIRLGRSDLEVPRLGVGAMTWGNPSGRSRWGPASLSAGVDLFDTAAMYSGGASERRLGELAEGGSVVIATKFPPGWLSKADALPEALDQSLARLRRRAIDLYQHHFPSRRVPIPSLMGLMADAVEAGKVRAIGVSNYSAAQLRAAHAALAERGIPLASNQVEYSLLHRAPEADGVLDACRELGITLIAYQPLAQGALTGKYRPGDRPKGIRRFGRYYRGDGLENAQPVVALLREIGERHSRTPAQVALRWLIQQESVLPIPGAKNERQAASNAEALSFTLAQAEVEALDRATTAD
jgi:aryl-alcohol dehydrogenase-like predicted oxidoreductase